MAERSDQPRYAQIADELRRRIDVGILGAGMLFPSDAELTKEFGVARGTLQKALERLRQEGLIYTVKGRGSVVSQRLPTRLISMDRYPDELTAALAGHFPQPDPALPVADVSTLDADADLARLFDAPAGTPLVRRHWVSRVQGVPAQMTTSYYPASLVPDVEAPLLRVGGGPIGWLVSVGVVPTRVREVSSSRPPTAAESAVFPTAVGWVVAVTRQIYAGERVVEVAREIVLPAQGVQFEHAIDLGG